MEGKRIEERKGSIERKNDGSKESRQEGLIGKMYREREREREREMIFSVFLLIVIYSEYIFCEPLLEL